MDTESLIRDLKQAVEGARGLSAADVDSVTDLIRAGEWELALDTLCTQTHEYDLDVSAEQKLLLVRLGQLLSVPVNYLLGDPWASEPSKPWF